MELSDPRHAAVIERLDANAPAAVQAVEYAYDQRKSAVTGFIDALDKLVEQAQLLKVHQMRSYNGVSNDSYMHLLKYEAMRRELVTLYAHQNFLEVKF